MKEIYTPKEWSAFFGGAPSLYIRDDGYIYTREEEIKLMGRPCGRIDYSKGYIYGSDYASVNPDPVGYLQSKNGITEIYAEYPGWNVKPILVIKGNEIYTYSEYTRIMGGNVSGYIKDDDSSGGGGSSGRRDSSKSDGSFGGSNSSGSGGSSESGGSFGGSGSSGGGCLGEAGIFAVIIGAFLLLTIVDEIRQMGAKFWVPFIVFSGLMFFGRYLRNKHAQGKSNPAPKPNPSPKPTPKPQPKPTPKPQPKPAPKPQPKPVPQPQPAETKIGSCPHCGAKCRIPAGNGKIRLTCPNPACRQQYEIDT